MLRLEIHALERRFVSLFVTSFLEWVEDARSSSFTRAAGVPEQVSFDKTAANAKTVAVRLTLTWPPSRPAVPPAAPRSDESAAREPLFTYESDVPAVFGSPVGSAGLTSMISAVFEQSIRLAQRTSQPPGRRVLLAERVTRLQRSVVGWTTAAARAAERLRRVGQQARSVVAMHAAARQTLVAGQGWWWAAAGLWLFAIVLVGWPAVSSQRSAHGDLRTLKPATRHDATLPRGAAPPRVATDAAATRDPRSAAMPVTEAQKKIADQPAGRRGFFGSLLVTSEPQGAEVSVDGIPRGRTPLAIGHLDAGSRVVRVELTGHQRWSWAVSVAANRQTRVAVKLWPATSTSH